MRYSYLHVTLTWILLVPIVFNNNILTSVYGQDPLYRVVTTSASSSQPWRSYPRSSSNRHIHSNRQQQRYNMPDYNIQYTDWATVQKDPRARFYKLDLKRRGRLNTYSITSKLVITTLTIFGIQIFKPSITNWGMKISDKILRGEQLYRLVTPIFLHGGILHLFTNMVSLQRIGPDVEKLFGSGRYITMYLLAGIGGNIMSAIRSPNPSLGASGAVFGIVGAYFIFLNRNEWLLGNYGQTMTTAIAQTMGMNFMLGLMNPQIDQWGHLGGLLAGGIMAYLFGPRLYLVDLPNTPDNLDGQKRTIVDIPIFRAPKDIEQIPGKINEIWDNLTFMIQTQIGKLLPGSNNNTKPWQQNPNNTNNSLQEQFRRQYLTPNRSIKPGKV